MLNTDELFQTNNKDFRRELLFSSQNVIQKVTSEHWASQTDLIIQGQKS